MNRIMMKWFVFAMLAVLVSSAAPDQDENCQHWADMGECDKVCTLGMVL
jgi:hypothetical protein